jgi:hypothetical protein
LLEPPRCLNIACRCKFDDPTGFAIGSNTKSNGSGDVPPNEVDMRKDHGEDDPVAANILIGSTLSNGSEEPPHEVGSADNQTYANLRRSARFVDRHSNDDGVSTIRSNIIGAKRCVENLDSDNKDAAAKIAVDEEIAAADEEAAADMAVDDDVAARNSEATTNVAPDDNDDVAAADEVAAADNPSDGDEHQDEMKLRRSPRFGNRTSDIVVPKNAKPYVENVHPEKKRRRRKVANESTIWANEPDKRLMTWWKKEVDNNKLEQTKRKREHQLEAGWRNGEEGPSMNLAHLKNFAAYRSGLESTTKKLKSSTPPHVRNEDLEEFIQRSFQQWGWYNEEQFSASMKFFADEAVKAKAAEDDDTRKYYNAMCRTMKKERKFYRRHLEAEYLSSVPAVLESVKYRRDIDEFYGRMVYTVPDPDNPGNLVQEILEDRIDEEWVRRAYSREMVEHIINLDSGDGYVAVPQTAEPVRVQDKPIDRVRYRQPYKVLMPDTQVGVGAVAKTKQTCSRGNRGGRIRNKVVDVPGAWFAKVGGVAIETRRVNAFGKVWKVLCR